jgi:hypothetical protein
MGCTTHSSEEVSGERKPVKRDVQLILEKSINYLHLEHYAHKSNLHKLSKE